MLFKRKISAELAALPIFMLSKDLLNQNKRAVARPRHLADIDALSYAALIENKTAGPFLARLL
jgi:hypothetical protein